MWIPAMPQLYMIGGPNGAGKTTAATNLLPKPLRCYENDPLI
jgi:predicted ABC-type ATPase